MNIYYICIFLSYVSSSSSNSLTVNRFPLNLPSNKSLNVFIPFHFHECVNRLTLGLLDPHSRQPAFKQSSVKIESIVDQSAAAVRNHAARTF